MDAVELGVIDEIVAASWRMRRLGATETGLLNNAIDDSPEPNALGRIASAFSTQPGSGS